MARSLGRWTLALDGSGALPSRELIGGKAWSIARMGDLGLPVPPAVVVTTEACAACLDSAALPPDLVAELGTATACRRPAPRTSWPTGRNSRRWPSCAAGPALMTTTSCCCAPWCRRPICNECAAGPLQRDFPLVTAPELEEAARLMRVAKGPVVQMGLGELTVRLQQ